MANQTINNYSRTTTYNLPDGIVQGPDGANANVVSLNLVSQNAPDYTVPINENFLYLLENFASNAGSLPYGPAKAIRGQLWYDITNASPSTPGVLKINNSTTVDSPDWRNVSSLVAGNVGELQYNDGANTLAATPNMKYFTGNGVLAVDQLSITTLANVQANLRVVGNATLLSNLTVSGNANVTGTGNIIGNVTMGANLTVTSNVTANIFKTSGSGNIYANSGYVIGNTVQGNLISTTSAPGTTTDPGVTGQIAIGPTAIYVCIATNTWRKVDITTF